MLDLQPVGEETDDLRIESGASRLSQASLGIGGADEDLEPLAEAAFAERVEAGFRAGAIEEL